MGPCGSLHVYPRFLLLLYQTMDAVEAGHETVDETRRVGAVVATAEAAVKVLADVAAEVDLGARVDVVVAEVEARILEAAAVEVVEAPVAVATTRLVDAGVRRDHGRLRIHEARRLDGTTAVATAAVLVVVMLIRATV